MKYEYPLYRPGQGFITSPEAQDVARLVNDAFLNKRGPFSSDPENYVDSVTKQYVADASAYTLGAVRKIMGYELNNDRSYAELELIGIPGRLRISKLRYRNGGQIQIRREYEYSDELSGQPIQITAIECFCLYEAGCATYTRENRSGTTPIVRSGDEALKKCLEMVKNIVTAVKNLNSEPETLKVLTRESLYPDLVKALERNGIHEDRTMPPFDNEPSIITQIRHRGRNPNMGAVHIDGLGLVRFTFRKGKTGITQIHARALNPTYLIRSPKGQPEWVISEDGDIFTKRGALTDKVGLDKDELIRTQSNYQCAFIEANDLVQRMIEKSGIGKK